MAVMIFILPPDRKAAGGRPPTGMGIPGPTSAEDVPPAASGGLPAGRRRPRELRVGRLALRRHLVLRADAEDALHLLLDLRHQRRVVLEEHLRVLTPLADALRAVAVPGAGLVDDSVLRRDVEHEAGVADPLGVHDVELRLPER